MKHVVLVYQPNPLASQHAQEDETYVTHTFGPFETSSEASEWAKAALPSKQCTVMMLHEPA